MAAILDTCEHFRDLYLSGCGSISNQDLQAILSKAKSLESLVVVYNITSIDSVGPILTAEDMLGSEWAVISLKEFCCEIVVKRHKVDHAGKIPDGDSDEARQSYEVQRIIGNTGEVGGSVSRPR